MAHGGYGKRKLPERNNTGRRSKGLGAAKKPKNVSLKNQIRSLERFIRKDLPSEVKEAQVKKLEGLKKQQDIQTRLAVERKIFLRDRKIKFFERRKIERRIRRLEKQQRTSSTQAQDEEVAEQLSKLKEDLEYVRFFPKTEKYVSLFTGGDESDIVDKRNRLRKQIKANIIAAAASGKDLEETGSEDDGHLDLSDDDFFLSGSSSDEAEADDEWTDKSTREQASSASGKAASGMSSDERNQRQISSRVLMPPPRPSTKSFPSSGHAPSRFGSSSRKNQSMVCTSNNSSNRRSLPPRGRVTSSSRTNEAPRGRETSNSRTNEPPRGRETSNSRTNEAPRGRETSNSRSNEAPRGRETSNSRTSEPPRGWETSNSRTSQSSNLSSNSDAHKPKRKRRPKKKKQQT